MEKSKPPKEEYPIIIEPFIIAPANWWIEKAKNERINALAKEKQ